ncbi:MAG: alanine racemase [Holophaga sp.]|nr:alanine racemase [Holophaga sp.]
MLYQTHIRIHLENIRRNLEGIRKAIGPTRKLLIAVKGNAYGHGAVEVSRMAQQLELADWLGVATVPEAISLRQAGVRLPILKFSPAFSEEMAAAVTNGVTLAVCEKANISSLQAVCAALGIRGRVHLKVDTGMGRVGVSPEQAGEMAHFIEQDCPDLDLEGLFTHLPASDDQAQAAYTGDQITRFKAILARIETTLGRTLGLVHCCNSGGVLGHEAGWLSMVRPGIMVYGHYPDESTPRSIPLYPGMSFRSRISFVKEVAKGTSIGYGRSWTAPEATWIGTLSVGYADGFNRLFSNRGRVLVNGRSYPVVGRVCMDQTMIDLGPETEVRVGDEVILIGRSGALEITVEEWAKALGTITYEVTCQINSRVERIFVRA